LKVKWLIVIAIAWLCGCNPKIHHDANRLCLLIEDKAGSNIRMYDFVSMNYSLKTQEGKVLHTTGRLDRRAELLFAGNPRFKGDLNTALTQLSEGDSALIRVNVDSMVQKMHISKPVTKSKYLIYQVRINKVLTRGSLSDSQLSEAIETMRLQEIETAHITEPQKISDYILSRHIKALSMPSGLIAVTTSMAKQTRSSGVVSVNYKISTLDGTLLETNDSSLARQAGIFHPRFNYKPYTTKADATSSHWFEQAASILPAKVPVTFIVPSKLAYGKQGTRNVEPYTPLLCQMQLTP